jgi:hypothetical protein
MPSEVPYRIKIVWTALTIFLSFAGSRNRILKRNCEMMREGPFIGLWPDRIDSAIRYVFGMKGLPVMTGGDPWG